MCASYTNWLIANECILMDAGQMKKVILGNLVSWAYGAKKVLPVAMVVGSKSGGFRMDKSNNYLSSVDSDNEHA